MPRNGSGTYQLPQPPFQPQTTISSSAVNSDFNDIGDALTASLARDGQGGMTATLPLDSSGFRYVTDPNTGMRRSGADAQAIVCGGNDIVEITADGLNVIGDLSINGAPQGFIVGEIKEYALPTLPSSLWQWCDGGALTTPSPLRTALIAAGNPYGVSGSDPLKPDKRGRAGFGKDNMGGTAANRVTTAGSGIDGKTLGAAGGAETVALTAANNGPHNHGGATGNTQPAATSTVSNGITGGQSASAVPSGEGSVISPNGNGFIVVSTTVQNHNHTIPSDGSGTPHQNMPPAEIFNYIIFVGA